MTERAERITMNAKLLERLRQVTEEEKALLAGDGTVERARYTSRGSSSWTAQSCWKRAS